MRRQGRFPQAAPSLLILVLLAAAGCQKASRYGPAPNPGPAQAPAPAPAAPAPGSVTRPDSADPGLQWELPRRVPEETEVRIEFVQRDTSPDEWSKLPGFWNAPPLTRPTQVAALVGLLPGTGARLTIGPFAAAQPGGAVRIKVPLGLDDPAPYIPASNSPTLGKWLLGWRLFFDDRYLADKRGTSCAGCHVPDRGFTDERDHDGWNTPTLINCVYNSHQFWDGRATFLEEVVEPLRVAGPAGKGAGFPHSWPDAAARLRTIPGYAEQFDQVFGCEPTQDALARALATYLRTILAGNSIHDQALRERGGSRQLEAKHYAAVLNARALQVLVREKTDRSDVAAELYRGYGLFRGKAGCYQCHGGDNFTDNQFHNLGVGWREEKDADLGKVPGRFRTLPVGLKDPRLIGAFKTPTLRSLLRTGPYQHDGGLENLREVIDFYNKGCQWNRFLDERLRDPRLPNAGIRLNLDQAEVEALLLFLRALNGDDVDAFVRTPPPTAQ